MVQETRIDLFGWEAAAFFLICFSDGGQDFFAFFNFSAGRVAVTSTRLRSALLRNYERGEERESRTSASAK